VNGWPRHGEQRLPVAMRNLEFKARRSDLEHAETIALSIGAEFGGDLHQRDTYFNAPTGRLKLREQERRFPDRINHVSSELIYYERPEESATRWSDYVRAPVTADASAEMRDLLSRALGVRQQVEKRRRLYVYRGARIHLDHVERLGTLIEFEVPTEGDEAAARAIMRELMRAFGLTDADAIRASYGELMEKTSA
jgi:adenylate cyclase class 2